MGPGARAGVTLGYDVDASFRGRAAHFAVSEAPPTSTYGGLYFPVDAAQFEAGLYVSAWVRIHRAADTGFVVLIEGSDGNAADYHKLSLDQSPGEYLMAVSTVGTPDGIAGPSGSLPNDAWVCIEYATSTVGGFAALDVAADGVTTRIESDGTFEGFQQVAVGISVERDAVDVWFDDVTVATSRVGSH